LRILPLVVVLVAPLHAADCNDNGIDDLVDIQARVVIELPQRFEAGIAPRGVIPLDLENDGDLDVTVVGADGVVALFVNDGRGDVTQAAHEARGHGSPQGWLSGDLDADGDTDLILTTTSASLLFNQGDGTFSSPTRVPGYGSFPANYAIGDLDGDADLDFVVDPASGGMYLLLNDGAGGLAEVTQFGGDTLLDGSSSLVLADLDADGLADLTVGKGQGPLTGSTYEIYRVSEGPAFRSMLWAASPIEIRRVKAHHVDRDGLMDLVFSTRADVDFMVVVNRGSGAFQSPNVTRHQTRIWDFTVVDLDGDGDQDIALSNREHGTSWSLQRERLVFRAGGGVPESMLGESIGIEAGDLDGDSLPELLCAAENLNSLTVFRNASIPAFSKDLDENGLPDECTRPVFHRGDANGDGVLDVSDGLCILAYLFEGTAEPRCAESRDANNDGLVDCSDAVTILFYLFLGTAAPARPGPPPGACGEDPDPAGSGRDLGCAEYAGCRG